MHGVIQLCWILLICCELMVCEDFVLRITVAFDFVLVGVRHTTPLGHDDVRAKRNDFVLFDFFILGVNKHWKNAFVMSDAQGWIVIYVMCSWWKQSPKIFVFVFHFQSVYRHVWRVVFLGNFVHGFPVFESFNNFWVVFVR